MLGSLPNGKHLEYNEFTIMKVFSEFMKFFYKSNDTNY